MNQLEHQWVTFYSPRNGRLSIQACNICGVAKGIVTGKNRCMDVSPKRRQTRLRGWTTQSNSDRSHSLGV